VPRFSREFLVSLSVLAVLLLFQAPVRHVALSFLRFPFTVVNTSVKIVVGLPRLPSLARENAELRSALAQQQLEVSRLHELARHAEQAGALRDAVPAERTVVASVIARSTLPTQHTLLLDHGSRHGLTLNSTIVDVSGVIGRVIEIQPDTALVMLLTDAESRVAALVERSRETGLVVGRGSGECELIYLDEQADVETGDRILTAGLGGTFPKGLVLGTVTRVMRDEATGSARATIAPAARLSRLEEVLCVPASD